MPLRLSGSILYLVQMNIYPLGDRALTLEFGNVIDENINDRVIALFEELKSRKIKGITDLVPAYCSLTLHFDGKYNDVKELVEEIIAGKAGRREELTASPSPRQIKIPVCYDKAFGTDLETIAALNNITVDEIIALHSNKTYRVYMLGFLPGFPYMGITDPKIEIQRKPQPVMVKTGAVGIAGKQTGIYPLDSPGGWQIIGRTPMKLFDPLNENPSLLKPGDEVSFHP